MSEQSTEAPGFDSEADQRLTKIIEFQERVFSKLDDMVFVKDDEFRIVMANPAFLALYPPEQRDRVIGFTTFEEYDDEQRALFQAEDRKALSEGYAETLETIDFPSGERRTLRTRKSRFEDADGRAHVLAVAHDVTDETRAREALEAANEELEEFAYRISHDLKSPLGSSLKLMDLLREAMASGDAPTSEHLLATVSASLARLKKLVEDILDVTRLRHADMSMAPVDVVQIVEDAWSDCEALAVECSVRLITRFACDEPVYGDRYGIGLLVSNLLSNAVKYSNPEQADRFVEIDVAVNKRTVRLAVTDNGLGFPEEFRPELFGMFKRFHAGKTQGTGLGLYMVARWVRRLGGHIEVDHLEQGTRFRIDLPQSKPAA